MACEKMKKNRMLLLIVLLVLVISSASFYFVWMQHKLTEQKPSPPLFILGTLYGHVVDSIAQNTIDEAIVEIYDAEPFSEKITALTDSSGKWEAKNVNLTEPIIACVSREGYYPLEGATRLAEKQMEGLYSLGSLGLFRISSNFTFSVSQSVSEPGSHAALDLQDGQELTISRMEALILDIWLKNYDETAALGQKTRYVNTVSIWVFPMEDTVSLDFGGNITIGRGEWKSGPVYKNQVVDGVYQLGSLGTSAIVRFQEIGSYTVFIRFKDNYQIYVAMTIIVDVNS